MQLAPKDGGKIETLYKKKLSEYEGKIRELKRYEAQQQKLLKQTSEQEGKIQGLTEEIAKMKQQKLELVRKLKSDRDSFERLKKDHRKETLQLKRETLRQKLLINKLTKEKERATRAKEGGRKEPKLAPPSGDLRRYVDGFTDRLVSLRREIDLHHHQATAHRDISTRLEQRYKELYSRETEAELLAMTLKELDKIRDCDKVQRLTAELEQNVKAVTELQTTIDNLESMLQYHEEKTASIERAQAELKDKLAQYGYAFDKIACSDRGR